MAGLSPAEIQEAVQLGILPSSALQDMEPIRENTLLRTPRPIPQVAPPIPASILPQTLGAIGAAQSSPPTPTPTRALPQALASSGNASGVLPRVSLTPTPGPTSPLSTSLAARREALNKQLEELNKPADYTALQGQMAERQRVGADDMFASVLSRLGPEAVSGMSEPLLKQSMAARQPMKVEGGMMDEQGQVMMDPGYQRNKTIDQVRNRLQQLDQLELTAKSDAEKAALAHERTQMMGLIAAIAAQARRDTAGATGDKSTDAGGVSPVTGNRLSRRPNGDMIEHLPDGTAVAFTGQPIPKTAFEKDVKTSQGLGNAVQKATALIARLEDPVNEGTFGAKPSLISAIPSGLVQSKLMSRVLTPDQIQLRAQTLRQAAQEIHDIYGAALTKGENAASLSWALKSGETIETIIPKLYAAKQWAESNQSAQSTAARNTAASRTGGAAPTQAQAPAAGGGDLVAQAKAELARRQGR